MTYFKSVQLKKKTKPKPKSSWGMKSGSFQKKSTSKPKKPKVEKIYKSNTAQVVKHKKSNTVQVVKNGKSNTAQVFKVREKDEKKMKESEYRDKCDWIFTVFPLCQICNKRKSEQAHHARYGYRGRDDRTILAVCEPCHYEIHHGKNGVEQSRDELELLGEATHILWGRSKC